MLLFELCASVRFTPQWWSMLQRVQLNPWKQ